MAYCVEPIPLAFHHYLLGGAQPSLLLRPGMPMRYPSEIEHEYEG